MCTWYSVPVSQVCHWQISQWTIITEENCRKEMANLQNQHFCLSCLRTCLSILVPPRRSSCSSTSSCIHIHIPVQIIHQLWLCFRQNNALHTDFTLGMKSTHGTPVYILHQCKHKHGVHYKHLYSLINHKHWSSLDVLNAMGSITGWCMPSVTGSTNSALEVTLGKMVMS